MKKNMIVGIALAMGMLSVGAVSASAAGSCCNNGKCADKLAFQQFTQETAALTGALKAKDSELREQNAYTISEASIFAGPDIAKINVLESEIKELKAEINAAAQKFGILPCCLS